MEPNIIPVAAGGNSGGNPLLRLYDGYLWTLTFVEPKVQDWLLVRSPAPMLLLICFYYNMIYFGPRLMRDRPAFRLKWLLVVYNLLLAALNLHIAFVLFYNAAYKLRYSIFCEPCVPITKPEHMEIACALWWYWFSKFIEFGDTLFFILRKKNSQMSFLHVYHHSTMPFFWWIGVKWVPGGVAFFCAGINSVVHVFMYAYYGLSALGPAAQKYLWWKKYLTILQLVQFTVVLSIGIIAIRTTCEFPVWMQWSVVIYMSSFLVLFGNFYLHAYYIKNKRGAAKRRLDQISESATASAAIQQSSSNSGGVSNGIVSSSSSSSSRPTSNGVVVPQHQQHQQQDVVILHEPSPLLATVTMMRPSRKLTDD